MTYNERSFFFFSFKQQKRITIFQNVKINTMVVFSINQ